MKVVLNEVDQIFRLTPCIAQIDESKKFYPCVLGITENNLVLFSDLQPDVQTSDELVYDVKMRIPVEDVIAIIYEKIKGDPKLTAYHRINVIHKVVDNSFHIYFLRADKKMMKLFLKNLKYKTEINIKKRKVDLSPIY